MEVSRNVKGSLWESINVLSPKLCFFWSIIVPPHLCHHCTAISCAYVPHPSIQPYPHCNICIVSLYPVKQICSLVSVGIHEESFSSINARQHPTRASQHCGSWHLPVAPVAAALNQLPDLILYSPDGAHDLDWSCQGPRKVATCKSLPAVCCRLQSIYLLRRLSQDRG